MYFFTSIASGWTAYHWGMGETKLRAKPSALVRKQKVDAPKKAVEPDRVINRAFAALLVISFYYVSYRYPFQVGDAGSSPTYSATPPWLQAGKYVLIGVVLAVITLVKVRRRGARADLANEQSSATPTASLFMGVWAVAKGVLVGSVDMTIVGFMMLVGSLVGSVRLNWRIDPALVTKHISVFAIIAVVVEAIQLTLFHGQGRLPALGYKDSISVRFGSLLDDPNTFAILVGMLLPTIVIAWHKHRFWRAVFVSALLVSLVITQSFTGIASVAVALTLGWFSLNWRKQFSMAAFIVGFPALLFGIWSYATNSVVVDLVLTSKAGSLDTHGSSWEVLMGLGVTDLMGFGVPHTFIESSYVNLIVSFGLLFTLMYLGIGIAALFRLHRIISRAEDKRAVAGHFGFYFYIITFLVASLNMQFDGIFPANILYVLGVCLSLLLPTQGRGQELPAPLAVMAGRRSRSSRTRNMSGYLLRRQ